MIIAFIIITALKKTHLGQGGCARRLLVQLEGAVRIHDCKVVRGLALVNDAEHAAVGDGI